MGPYTKTRRLSMAEGSGAEAAPDFVVGKDGVHIAVVRFDRSAVSACDCLAPADFAKQTFECLL